MRGFALAELFAVIAIVGLLLSASTRRVEAAWQPSQIAQGDGHGGAITHPAYKQTILAGPAGSMTIPFGLAQMDNGQIAMVGVYEVDNVDYPVIGFSSDGGNSWSAFQAIPGGSGGFANRPMMLTYLGGSKLSYILGRKVYFSSDYGKTWPSVVSYQLGANVANSDLFDLEGNAGVDRDASGNAVRLNEISYSCGKGYPYTSLFGYSLDGGRTWQGQVAPPAWTYTVTHNGTTYTRGTSEGSVVRAANGWLVAALRTDALPQYAPAAGNDPLEGLAVSISKDDGKTWSAITRLFNAGRHHANLQRLPNNDLLMTMIVRNDIRTLDPTSATADLSTHMRGADALLSHDNGLTWNLDRRITLDAFNSDPGDPLGSYCGHVASTVLGDGSVLTVYGKYVDGSAVLIKWNPTTLKRRSQVKWPAKVGGMISLSTVGGPVHF